MPTLSIQLPDWLNQRLQSPQPKRDSLEARMQFVLQLAQENIVQKTGGPFAAAIFDAQGQLLAAGVNLVESGQCSLLHAEIVALAQAENILHHYNLSAAKQAYQLVSSTEPCAMCLGAIPWAGIAQLVCGARDEDARAIGFDEGAKPEHWPETLEQRGIQVIRDVMRPQAQAVLAQYAAQGGHCYNGAPLTRKP